MNVVVTWPTVAFWALFVGAVFGMIHWHISAQEVGVASIALITAATLLRQAVYKKPEPTGLTAPPPPNPPEVKP